MKSRKRSQKKKLKIIKDFKTLLSETHTKFNKTKLNQNMNNIK